METILVWTGGMEFTSYFKGGTPRPEAGTARAELGSLAIPMDSKPPFGKHSAPTPKEVVLAGLLGCSAMDVVSLLRKWKENFATYEMKAAAVQGPITEGVSYPTVFKEIDVEYEFTGDARAEKVIEAVKLSQTLYCGVSAMIAQTAEIRYTVVLNGEHVGSGKAEF